MRLADYNPRTLAGLDLYDYARETATRTGRVTFGQLWLKDPTIDEMASALFAPAVAEGLNQRFPLKDVFNHARRGPD